MRTPLRLLLLPVLLLVACPAQPDLYRAVASPDGEVPAALTGERWLTHFREDIAPYWPNRTRLGRPPETTPPGATWPAGPRAARTGGRG